VGSEMKAKFKYTIRVVDIGLSSDISIAGQLPVNPFDLKQKKEKSDDVSKPIGNKLTMR
jgi:hypothetical protein